MPVFHDIKMDASKLFSQAREGHDKKVHKSLEVLESEFHAMIDRHGDNVSRETITENPKSPKPKKS